jgi:fructose-1-phosphate kinase PfkB-like protein
MAAGIVTGVLRGQDVPEACRLGTACGVANAMVPVSGYLRREDVERVLPMVSLTVM